MTTARQPLYLNPAAINLAWNEPQENLRRVEEVLRARLERSPEIPSEAQLFVFPELTLTGFVTKNPPSFSVNPPQDGVERLCELAARHNTGIVAGFPEANLKNPKRPYNALALIGPDGKVAAAYRKMHLFTVGDSPEAASYAPGTAGVTAIYRGWKVALAVCFDIRFSGLFHQYARAGADLVVVSACWVGGPHKTYQYQTLNSAHAVLTQAYVAAVNQAGKDPYYEYDGAEYVFSPFGENIYKGSPCLLDPKELEACRKLSVRGSDLGAYPVAPYPKAK